MTVYYSYNDPKGEPTDLETILITELPLRSDKQLIEIVSDYRGVYDEREIHKTENLDEVLYDLRATEVIKACENFDLDYPYFEYDGKTVTGIDNVYDHLTYNEVNGIIEWLKEDDRWEDYPELCEVIRTKEE